MSLDEIQQLLDDYGFEYILKAHDLNELEVLSILDELGYVNLEEMKDAER